MPLADPTATPTILETLEDRFRRLDATWRKETAYQSSSTKIRSHPAFREVVGLGDAVVPLLLRDLEAKPSLWVWALHEIFADDPVPLEDRGNLSQMTEAWLRWGKAKGLTW